MSNTLIEKFVCNYSDKICGFGNSDLENFGGVITNIDYNGYVYVDYGYGIKAEHIINIRQSDVNHSEEVD